MGIIIRFSPHLIKSAIITALISIQVNDVLSQEVLSSSGGAQHSSTITLNYTIGPTFVDTIYGTGIVLTQGFHQPLIILASLEPETNNFISVFPNPFINEIVIENSESKSQLNFSIIDPVGRILLQGKCKDRLTSINLEQLPGGQYHLVVVGAENNTFTYSILKTN